MTEGEFRREPPHKRIQGGQMWLLRSLRKIRVALDFWRYRQALRQKLGKGSRTYEQYLDIQLRRTLLKKKNSLQKRTKIFVDKLEELTDLKDCDVLCVGCRNLGEINYFRQKGVKRVVGIDLYSEHKEILVMDMHHMNFPDKDFDIVYSSHSLEHAYDTRAAAAEFVRVARPGALLAVEVPVQYETRGADLVDIENLQELSAVFGPQIAQVLWSEKQPPHSPRNDSDSAIIRIVLLVDKKT